MSHFHFAKFSPFLVSVLWSFSLFSQEEYQTISLWDGKAPEAIGTDRKDNPEGLLYLLPENGQPEVVKPCLVILPGGGYGGLAIDHEGYQIARWANSLGMHAIICKYRTRKDGYGHPAPWLDAQRAVRLFRAKANEWRVDPKRVGIIGFSAGGHLASTVLTHFDNGDRISHDPIAKESSRPDFGILCYPVIAMSETYSHAGSRKNLLGADPDPKLIELLDNHKQVTSETPPTFLFHTQEDVGVHPDNSLAFYASMVRSKVPGELHIFQKGKHGVGLGLGIPGTEGWSVDCKAWLVNQGTISP
jgi:acetyl esterase/lipase